MQGRRTKRSRSQKIFNIKAGGGQSGAGATGTALNARIIYKNISLFLNQLDKNTLPASGTAGRSHVKIISKVVGGGASKSGGGGLKTSFISISTFSYIDLSNSKDLYNYINLCVAELNNFNKHMGAEPQYYLC